MDLYLNSVLDAFSKMDAESIGDLLDPQYTYQGDPLESFTKNLRLIFEEFQADGDTDLEVLRGNCFSLTCNPDLIRTAYRFVGNQTRNYLDLRFILEPTEDLKDQVIKDIFQCNSLLCIEGKDWFGDQKLLNFSYDKVDDVLENIEDVINLEIALEAYPKLFDHPKSITLEETKAWLLKYQPSFDYFQDQLTTYMIEPLAWYPFYDAYDFLKSICELMENLAKEERLNLAQIQTNLSEKDQLEMVRLFEKILLQDEPYLFQENLEEENNFRVTYQKLEFVGKPFEDFSILMAWFRPLRSALVKKYYSLTEAETEQFLDSNEYLDPEYALTLLGFHMDIRDRARENGEWIPFGLGTD